ncbi:hypothetical protein NE865_07248 [Phthorimaea operculella]|nr:hypothetical protein NE865_07248 [Phthorimaea operculella]
MKSKPAHYVDPPFRPWPPLSRQAQPNFYFRPPDPMDMRNFKTSSSKGSTYSDFSGMSAYSNKSRDYYFLSPSYRSAGAPTPSGHADLYLQRERPRQLRHPHPHPSGAGGAAATVVCPCSRSRSLEDVRTDVVTEWEDDDENGNRIVAPATKFNRTSYKANTAFQKQGFLTRHSMENLVDRPPQVLPPKRITAFQAQSRNGGLGGPMGGGNGGLGGVENGSRPTFKPVTVLEDLQAVRCAEFHPNGKLYAVGSNTKTLRICTYPKIEDVKDNSAPTAPTVLLKRTKHHKGSIYCLAWSPAGDLLATGSNDKTVKLMRDLLATGSNDKTVKLMRFNSHTCNLPAGYRLQRQDSQADEVQQPHVQPGGAGGDLLATGSNDKTVKLMRFNSHTCNLEGQEGPAGYRLQRQDSQADEVQQPHVQPGGAGGDLLATGSNDKTVKLMRFNSHTCNLEGQEVELTMHDGTVRDVCFIEDTSNKTSLLVSGGAGDCKIYVTDCATGKTFQVRISDFPDLPGSYIRLSRFVCQTLQVRISRDGCFIEDTSNKTSLLVSGGAGDCKIYVTDCATGKTFQVRISDLPAAAPRGRPSRFVYQTFQVRISRNVCFIEDTSNKTSLLVSGGAGDCKIYVTDCATGKTFQIFQVRISCDVCFIEDTSNKTSLLVSGGAGDCKIYVTDCATGKTFQVRI